MYGHVNNMVYYSFFGTFYSDCLWMFPSMSLCADTVINEYEIKHGNLRPRNDLNNPYGVYCVSSSCTYLAPLHYPQIVEAGLSVERIGNTSVVYHVGIFIKGEDDQITARAYGDFVHVFVDKETNKKTPVPTDIRRALELILID